jgi:carbon-monoxide dehydrogenase small subunit
MVCSCLVLGVEAEGREITTVEGMADGENLHPLQRQSKRRRNPLRTRR